MEARNYVPTSVQLSKLLGQAQDSEVSIGWLVEQLGRRSFGLAFLVMAVVALLPGASTIVGLLVAWAGHSDRPRARCNRATALDCSQEDQCRPVGAAHQHCHTAACMDGAPDPAALATTL